MAKFLRLVNGLPTSVEVTISQTSIADPYDESIAYPSGLAADTPITLPSAGYFTNSAAKDILIIANDLTKENSRDFTVIGSGPEYNQISFNYNLPTNSIVRFHGSVGGEPSYDESIYYSSGLTAGVDVTFPNGGSYTTADQKKLLIIVNGTLRELDRDYSVVGSGPTFTAIEFLYDLPNDSIVRIRYPLPLVE